MSPFLFTFGKSRGHSCATKHLQTSFSMNLSDFFVTTDVAIVGLALIPAACLLGWLTYDEFTNGW